ncbi:hypothetical protein BBK36DRAFT_1107152 [Trichoderma citrinoviride]|uniref:Uncharacterized protein n=1 Tax=Trichoderma citrinoviride TaxID=58853 RepID=A0A2T4BNE2_9HYPO|nr:hypothetical protein BBK36DRAFT_1107152 [Trichoderma citrinoviride]PTB70844.1 hypothetical protein BBK36DRAFT_1107152 [Trichoderma citrinoviride]
MAHDDAQRTTTPTPTVTEAPIYLPYYDERSWSLVRGSIISTDPSASRTTFTIFCPTQTPPACDLSLEFPFVIVEGPGTLEFHGTVTSTYIADVECDLNGTTAATCSGYSSYKAGYTNGRLTGPTQLSWTSTFTGSEVQWGTLTMAEAPGATDDAFDPNGTMTVPTASGMMYEPSPTSMGSSLRVSGLQALYGIMAGIVAVCLAS